MRLAHRSATGLWIFFPKIHLRDNLLVSTIEIGVVAFHGYVPKAVLWDKERARCETTFRDVLFWPVCTLIRAPCFITIHAWPFLFPTQGRMIEVFL